MSEQEHSRAKLGIAATVASAVAALGWCAYFANFSYIETHDCGIRVAAAGQISTEFLVALPWATILLVQLFTFAVRRPLVPRVMNIIVISMATVWLLMLGIGYVSPILTCSHTDANDALAGPELISFLVVAPLAFVVVTAAMLKLLSKYEQT